MWLFGMQWTWPSQQSLRCLRSVNMEGSHSHCVHHNTCLDQLQADSENKDGSVQCLCLQHIAIQQQDMDHICQAREASEHMETQGAQL